MVVWAAAAADLRQLAAELEVLAGEHSITV
jgi:hypothetical protein